MAPDHPDRKDMTYVTGAIREANDGRGRFDLLPVRGLMRVALRCELGAVKYGDRNWEYGMPQSRFLNSALRHLCQYLAGQTDEDHLAAAGWNILAALDQEERAKEGRLDGALMDVPFFVSKRGSKYVENL